MSPAELSDTVKLILDDMVAVKNSKVTNAYNPRSSGATVDAHQHIVKAKESIDKLKKLGNSMADGTTEIKTFDNMNKDNSVKNAAKEETYRNDAKIQSVMKDAPITNYISANNPFP
jgi:chromosome condensin MukBEF MukE localization factor